MTTWKFEDNQIKNNQTIEVKVFENINTIQVRVGK